MAGVVRKIDSLGRIVIPVEMRKRLKWEISDSVDISINRSGQVILSKYENGCCICSSTNDVNYQLNKKNICVKCKEKLTEM